MSKLDYFKRFTYIPNEVYDHIKIMESAMAGDMAIVIFPAMKGAGSNEPAFEPTVAEADGFSFDVTIQLMNKAKSQIHEWFNGKLEVKVDKTSTDGTIAVGEGTQGDDVVADMDFENGVCKFTVTLGGTWEADDTVKVTVDDDNDKIMGYSVEVNDHFLVKVKADPDEET